MVWKTAERRGHQITRNPVLFTEDSKFFFSSAESAVHLYSVATGEVVRSLSGHNGIITNIIINPNKNNEIFTSSLDGTIKQWDYMSSTLVNSFEIGDAITEMALDNKAMTFYLGVRSLIKTSHLGLVGRFVHKLVSVKLPIQSGTVKTKHLAELSDLPRGLCITPNHDFVVAVNRNEIAMWDIQHEKLKTHRHSCAITSITVHPIDGYVVTGDVRGQIVLWHGLLTATKSKTFVKKILHWHAFGVDSLTFTVDGAYLLSGGEEGVLVMWQLETGTKAFSAKHGALIRGISTSSNGQIYALSMQNNDIRLYNVLNKNIDRIIHGFKKDTYLDNHWRGHAVFEPRNRHLVSNGLGILQFYDPSKDRFVKELEVATRNNSYRNDDGKLPDIVIDHFAFSKDGNDLVTIDSRDLRSVQSEVSLKFWTFDASQQQYVLNTQVDQPHSSKVVALRFHPTRPLVLTCSSKGKFKVWTRMENKPTSRSVSVSAGSTTESVMGYSWVCRSSGEYKKLSCSHADFSHDGSLMAITYGGVVTLWNPNTNTLEHELVHSHTNAINLVSFVPNSPYLVTCSDTHVTVWNLLTGSVWWSYQAHATHVAVDSSQHFVLSILGESSNDNRDDTVDRIIVDKSKKKQEEEEVNGGVSNFLVLFRAESPEPVCCWKTNGISRVAALAFIGQDSKNTTVVHTKRSLVYITEHQELFLIEEIQLNEDKIHIEDSTQIKKPLTDLLLNGETVTDYEAMFGKGDVTVVVDRSKRDLDDMEVDTKARPYAAAQGPIDTLFDTPSHVLPRLNSLYQTFMNVLVIKENSQNVPVTAPVTSTTSSVTSQTVEELNKQKKSIKKKKQKSKDVVQHELDNLSTVKKQLGFENGLFTLNAARYSTVCDFFSAEIVPSFVRTETVKAPPSAAKKRSVETVTVTTEVEKKLDFSDDNGEKDGEIGNGNGDSQIHVNGKAKTPKKLKAQPKSVGILQDEDDHHDMNGDTSDNLNGHNNKDVTATSDKSNNLSTPKKSLVEKMEEQDSENTSAKKSTKAPPKSAPAKSRSRKDVETESVINEPKTPMRTTRSRAKETGVVIEDIRKRKKE